MPQNDLKQTMRNDPSLAEVKRAAQIVRAARKAQKSAQFGVTDEQLATMISEQEKDLKAPDENWSEWVAEVRKCLKRAGLFTGNVSNGSGSATRPGLPPDNGELSMTRVGQTMTESRRQAVVAQLSQTGLTGRERAALAARGVNIELALSQTGFEDLYKGMTATASQERQADAVVTMPEERRQAVLKELAKSSGMQTDGFTPAERDEAEALVGRASSLQRGRDLPKLAAAVRDVAAVLEGKKAKSAGLLDRLKGLIEENEWSKRGWSAAD